MTDCKTGRLQDEYLIFYLKKVDYDNGVKELFNTIVREITPNMVLRPPRESRRNKYHSSGISCRRVFDCVGGYFSLSVLSMQFIRSLITFGTLERVNPAMRSIVLALDVPKGA